MPIVELQTEIPPEGVLTIGIDATANLIVPFALVASTTFGIDPPSSGMSNVAQIAANPTFGVDIDSASVLRLGAEPNVFMNAAAQFGLDMDSASNIGLILDLKAIGEFGVDVVPSTRSWSESEVNELNLIVDIVPNVVFPANYQEYKVRFKVDGTVVPIRKASISAPANKIGADVSVVLSRNTDRSLLSINSIYSLEVGFVVSGITTWYELISGNITSDSYNIGWNNNSPTDAVTLSSSALLSNRINISPYYPTVLYDSSFFTLDDDDFEPVYDISGNPYPTVRVPVGGLTFYNILSYAFGVIGMNYNINIPNFKVKRLDIAIGQSFFQAIGGLFGVYEPLILERNGEVYFIDSTLISGSGFDTPRQLTPSKYRSASLTKNYGNINGYIIQYVENVEAWDSYTDEDTESENIVEDVDEARITRVISSTTTRNYYRNSLPAVIVRSETIKVIVETWVSDPVVYGEGVEQLINYTEETFEYDGVGKIQTREKFESARLPFWNASTNPASADGDGYWEYDFRDCRYERDEYSYKDNKFKHGTEYRELLTQIVRELVYTDPDLIYETKDQAGVLDIDPDKEVPVDYKQRYVDAYRSGNLESEGEVSFEATQSRYEKTTPVTEELAKVETKEVDYLTNIITVNVTEEQVGEYAVNSQIGQTRIAIVYAEGGSRDSRRMETLNIGELPLAYGVALARRKLKRKNEKDIKAQVEIPGVDLAVKRGAVFNLVGRSSENLGNFITEGYAIDLDNLGTPNQVIVTSLDMLKT